MSESVHGRLAVILIVEDNEDDVELMRISFAKSKLKVDLHHAGDGEECMAFLRKEGKFAGAPTPDLILLDLNMPRMDGREVLTEMSRDQHFCHVPVVILTTSAADSEILSMYKLRCSSYIIKPVDFEKFQRVVQAITDYWFEVVVLPSDYRGTGNE